MDYATGMGVPGTPVALGSLNFAGRFVDAAAATSDATGTYLLTIAPGTYLAAQGSELIGTVNVLETGVRGDLLSDMGLRCVARYGVITDAQTHRPIENVRVRLENQTVHSDADGWYRLDLGCSGLIGFNTTFMYFDAPGYLCWAQVVGRGIFGVERIDMFLGRRAAAGGGFGGFGPSSC